jgi:Rps23 Pro-64 3,4-dihydroxylase Tpa1-like proline 4-hydroxylase
MSKLLSENVRKKLADLAEARALDYQRADPFPHIVLDDFLPPEILHEVLADFPSPKELKWTKREDKEEIKLEFTKAEMMPPSAREVLYFLNSPIVLRFLEQLTGIANLIPDPYFVGGGLHQIQPGGFLDVHADFNKYEKFGLDRRLNLLIYLNEDWKEEYGGCLELWDKSMTKCEKNVLPIFNRCVVFSTTSDSYHGHPLPLTCPPDRTRKSLAVYYYTNGRPEEEANESHSTLFQKRPGKELSLSTRALITTKKVVRSLLPPIITDTIYRIRTGQK